jgi:predicted amidophosphoribosyltransferase
VRGYNHAEVLAREVSNLLALPIAADTLVRIKKTKQQAKIHKKQDRLSNQQGVFAVTCNIKGKDILLIDDVTTTGATLEEARNTLLKAGARSVHAATVAH